MAGDDALHRVIVEVEVAVGGVRIVRAEPVLKIAPQRYESSVEYSLKRPSDAS